MKKPRQRNELPRWDAHVRVEKAHYQDRSRSVIVIPDNRAPRKTSRDSYESPRHESRKHQRYVTVCDWSSRIIPTTYLPFITVL